MLGKHYSKDSEGNTIIAEVELLQSKVGNLYYRPKTSDKTMLKESFSDYPTINCKDRVVMDCGSNIGGFILKACQDGAKSITSYEPEPLNLEILNLNASMLKEQYPNIVIDIQDKALCAGNEKELTFNLNTSSNSACSGSLIKLNRSFPVQVKACNFWEEVDRIKPDLIKMDIEGGEFDLITTEFPEFVKDVVIELHGFRKVNNEKMLKYVESIENNTRYKVVNKKICIVFGGPAIIIMHFSRV